MARKNLFLVAGKTAFVDDIGIGRPPCKLFAGALPDPELFATQYRKCRPRIIEKHLSLVIAENDRDIGPCLGKNLAELTNGVVRFF